MERSIIQKFQQLQVLSNFDYHRMDELVQDLATALEESSHGNSSGKARKRRGMKRRSKQNGMMINNTFRCLSEDSESSFDEALHLKEPFDSAQHLTDSDDVARNNCVSVGLLHYFKKQSPHGGGGGGGGGSFIESDSVNENFSPIRPHRRKRKFKRMAIDPIPSILMSEEQMKRKSKSLKLLKYCGDIENFYQSLKIDALNSNSCGKRKRSMRERSLELANDTSMTTTTTECPAGNSSKQADHVFLEPRQRRDDTECSMDYSDGSAMTSKNITESSSSSLSSSESDAGVYTNDEGREGDDEQSDYFESGPACGVPGVVPWWESANMEKSMDDDMDPEFHAILTGSFQHMSWNAQQAFRNRVSNMEVPKREIRAGRRRLHELRPGFSIMTSFNEKISKFLQDPDQNEKEVTYDDVFNSRLRLHPVRKKERNQLNSLASLYSLSMRTEGNSNNTYPVLSKTRNTMQAVNVQPTPSNMLSIGEIKRRRKTPPSSPVNEAFVGENSNPIDESNIGNQMLRNMGWEPGTGLGTENQGIQNPVQAVIRPKLQGLGFGTVVEKAS